MVDKGAPKKADGKFAVGAVAAAAVAGGVVLWMMQAPQDAETGPGNDTATATMSQPADPSDSDTTQNNTQAAASEPDAEADAGQGAETAAVDAPSGDATDAGAPAGVPGPRFDHVRVDKDGRAVVSGTAPGGFEVSVEVDGANVQTLKTDRSGQFAALLSLPISDAAQVVNLVARNAEGVELRSEDSVILAPRMEVGPEIVAALGNGAATTNETSPSESGSATGETELAALDLSGAPASGDGEGASSPAVTSVDETAQDTPYSEAMAPTVLLASRTGVELLQPANAIPERLRDRVVIDVISYSDDGSVSLEGRAAASGDRQDGVQAYLNNRPVQSADVKPDGRWHMGLAQVTPGVYTLRIDQVAPGGKVVARFETPFKREDPAELARLVPQLGATGAVGASVITVQPGYTLWGIANDRYGNGLDYVQIFDANKSQIRDPDLIYPGQIFELPDMEDAPAEAAAD
ncbi:LysM peptidoglycan-binding domain-containing protein [Tropicimonas sediminicola]|uniref:LysM domain-containing protein n=1 Tax=Tropicimonas sediminicola TaxID=1031541 RepID=A0A239DB02_9RHOB|nr:LysM peptidoglycan-binding domain-containing protein [Tropicimonas sediminicola]SNS28873.1 LysM domain-containing protein [Tropicimonas sediminicola]